MDLRPSLQIQTVIKAMIDVVLPAVDPNNKLAQEQARLVIGTLSIVLQRLPLTYRYERDELSRFLALADTLQGQSKALQSTQETLQELTAAVALGEDVLDRARAEPSELEAANFQLREKIGALVTALYEANPSDTLKHVSTTVTAHAKEQLLRERSWLIGQGWESNPQDIPAIESLIGDRPS
ncbi:MAG TPA: hypothetical protein VFY31_03010 [Macromonas sp.]|nr:hypothetical protein [Macromonas sp.]